MNIVEKLKTLGVEITSEIEKTFSGEFISELEADKKLKKLQTENETLKERLTTAEETLKGFEGKNYDEITRERDEWKKKAEESEKNHNEKMAELEKQELLKEAFKDIEFTSNSAKTAIMKQISDGVTVKNGKLIGFNDLLEDAKKNDASAFADKKTDTVKITSTTVNNNNSNNEVLTKKDIDGIKDTRERQKAIAESIARGDGIYQKP